MLMGNQHLYKSPAIEVYTLKPLQLGFYYPDDRGCLFCNLRLKNCLHGLDIDPITLDLSSQSGAWNLEKLENKIAL